MHPDFVEVSAIYQQFCDRNIELKKREDELQLNINKLDKDLFIRKPIANEELIKEIDRLIENKEDIRTKS